MIATQVQAYYAEYTAAYESGQISKEEYINLLQGLEVEQVVATTADELQLKEQLNVAINAAISVASALA